MASSGHAHFVLYVALSMDVVEDFGVRSVCGV